MVIPGTRYHHSFFFFVLNVYFVVQAIQGFRETERSAWSADNEAVLSRVRALAFRTRATDVLPHVHVLDLAAAGHIKPHVDAVRVGLMLH